MAIRGLVVLLCALLVGILARPADAEMNSRLSQQRFGVIALGEFQAGDTAHFTLVRYRDEFLLHFVGEPEIYVLYADYGSLGGRVLRYDSGAVAIQVAGWGAMTIYPDNHPDGLPATRDADAAMPALPQVSQSQLIDAADDEATHLAYVSGVHINFTADWPALANDPGARALIADTIGNTARGIARFTANPTARALFAKKVSTVYFQPSGKPLIQLSGKTLIVTYNPSGGFTGRASSRAIAFALGKLFKVPTPN